MQGLKRGEAFILAGSVFSALSAPLLFQALKFGGLLRPEFRSWCNESNSKAVADSDVWVSHHHCCAGLASGFTICLFIRARARLGRDDYGFRGLM